VRTKGVVERELIYAEAKVESLEGQLQAVQAEKAVLQAQVDKLQDALVSVRAPEAYRDQMIEKIEANQEPLSDEYLERNKLIHDTTTEYIKGIEGPLFKSFDDMDDLLTRALLTEAEGPASLHGNDES
jgi:chromosome segregation ATPase